MNGLYKLDSKKFNMSDRDWKNHAKVTVRNAKNCLVIFPVLLLPGRTYPLRPLCAPLLEPKTFSNLPVQICSTTFS